MAKTLQFRRGTTAELASVTGAEGELFVDINKDTVVVMDGSTPGGKALATEEFVLANAGTGGSVGGDVVFDSALIGDVSIISNTIGGVDSYGNPASLVIDGDLTVTGALVNPATLTLNANGSKSIIVDNTESVNVDILSDSAGTGTATFQFQNGNFLYSNNNPTWTDASKFVTDAVISINDPMYGPVVLKLTSDLVWLGTPDDTWQASYIIISGGSGMNYFNVATLNLSYTAASLATYSFDGQGNLTVNGQPLSTGGASYDQSLNTTDDVVFNSALVGDVSIVSNEISGVDSYGNAIALKVTSDLNVELGSQTTLSVVSQSSMNTIFYNKVSKSFQISDIIGGGPFSTNDYNSLVASIQAGSVITFVNAGFGSPIESFGNIVATVVSANVESGGTGAYLNVVVSSIMYAGSDFTNNDITFLPGEVQVVNGSTATVLEVTETGVNVNGALTVNGSTLNVLENTASGKAITVNTSTSVNEDIFSEGSTSFQFQNGTFFYSNNNPSWTDASKFVTGATISINDPMYGPVILELTSDLVWYGTPDDTWAASYVIISGGSGMNFFNVAVLNLSYTAGSSATYSFDDQGTFNSESIIATDALIGDVSIVGNTISGLDSYGIASDLILDGTVVYSGTITETPVNTSTVNKWMKVGAQVPSTILVVSEYDSINWMNGASYNSGTKTLSFDGITGSFQTALQSLSVGDTVRIYVPTYGAWFTLSLSSQFTEQGSPGPWTASVNEDVFGSPDTQSISLIEISLPSNTGPLETQYFYMPLYK